MEKQTFATETTLDDIAVGAWFLLNHPYLGFRECREWLEKDGAPFDESTWLFIKAAIGTYVLNARFR